MASPDRSKQKTFKAKKTMPASCRKQVEILNKSMDMEALKTTAIKNDNQNLCTMVTIRECRHSENVDSPLESKKNSAFSQKSVGFSQNLIKPIDEIFHSETRFGYFGQAVHPCQESIKTVECPNQFFIQGVKENWNTSETHIEYKANVTASFMKHRENFNLKSIYSSPTIFCGVVQNTVDDNRINKMASNLEANCNSELHGKMQNDILSSNSHLVPVKKIPHLVNSVICSSCAANTLKTEEFSRTHCSSTSNCESTDLKWESLLNTDSHNSHTQKKRMFSENKENVKRMKTSEQINENVSVALEKQTTVMEQVKHLIREEICSRNYKPIDKKLEELNERIGKTQCKNKYEQIAEGLFAKIAKLQRRIQAVVLLQRNCSEPNTVPHNNTACKIINSENMNLDKNQESNSDLNKRLTSVNCEPPNSSEKAIERIDLSSDCVDFVSESNDDVLLISVERPHLTTPVTSSPKDFRKTTSRKSSNQPIGKTEVRAVEKRLDCVIDLTEEVLSNINTESPMFTLESPVKPVLNSKEIIPVAGNAVEDLDFFQHLPPLPEPPPLLPDMVDKIQDTLPPQKPELKVKWVLRPMGIALTWNITKINPKCAPVESYHLFLCQKNSDDEFNWKKIGEIKALPLPMACTLSQFLASNQYYFTVQSKDIFGRYGPFCDIKYVPGFSETLSENL